MRIAVSGLVGEHHGSVSSAGYSVLQELLHRDYEIDFFSRPGFVPPASLGGSSAVRYVDCDTPSRSARRHATACSRIANMAFDVVDKLEYTRNVVRRLRFEQARSPYDLVLFLGQWAYGPINGVPVVSWVQGAPGTDVRSVLRHRAEIRRKCGLREYAGLRAYSLYRSSFLGRPRFTASDAVICGGETSLCALRKSYALPAEKLHALPYPVDLAQFAPGTPDDSTERRRLLWVGRVVPRKRLDLFLDAGVQLIEAGWDVTLEVIGDFPFARGFGRLLCEFAYPDRLQHHPHVERESIHARYRGAAVLVQPSEEENFGSSVAEALACGTPVVVGPTNGTKDYIGDGGVIFDDYAPTAVAAAIIKVLERERSRHDSMRLAARAAAVEHFSVDHVVDRLEAILSTSADRYTELCMPREVGR
jgi:glycosyltransferase involved in cell wall biosynthesis